MNKYKRLIAVKNGGKNIVNNLNHKINQKIVNVALHNGYGIKLENLNGLQKLNSKIRDVEKGVVRLLTS